MNNAKIHVGKQMIMRNSVTRDLVLLILNNIIKLHVQNNVLLTQRNIEEETELRVQKYTRGLSTCVTMP